MTEPSFEEHLQSGNALVAQAQTVATQDFQQARALWQQAGKHFYHAHKADPTHAIAAFRLAQAWMAEAYALQKEESANALVMWANAAAQCELAFDLDPDNDRRQLPPLCRRARRCQGLEADWRAFAEG